jgi:hypothetical protein
MDNIARSEELWHLRRWGHEWGNNRWNRIRGVRAGQKTSSEQSKHSRARAIRPQRPRDLADQAASIKQQATTRQSKQQSDGSFQFSSASRGTPSSFGFEQVHLPTSPSPSSWHGALKQAKPN